MSPVWRGFRGRGRVPAREEDRVPPGQYVTTDFPVLSAGPTPHTPLPEWTFSITQGGDTLNSWTWQETQALPAETVTVDIHCVTRWSKLGTQWRGVSVDTLLDQVAAEAPYVLAFCDGVYTTNLPTEDVTGGKAWVAFGYNGEPLEPEHGGPAWLLARRTCRLDRGYDCQPTRQLLHRLGFEGQIACKGIPAPIQAGTRWVAGRRHSPMNGFGKLRRTRRHHRALLPPPRRGPRRYPPDHPARPHPLPLGHPPHHQAAQMTSGAGPF